MYKNRLLVVVASITLLIAATFTISSNFASPSARQSDAPIAVTGGFAVDYDDGKELVELRRDALTADNTPDWVERQRAALKLDNTNLAPDWVERHQNVLKPASAGMAPDWVERHANRAR